MKESKTLMSSNSESKDHIAYSRAVVEGEWVFVSGTREFNYENLSIAENIIHQTEQCFKNIIAALRQADSNLEDIVRILYVVPVAEEFKICWPVLKK